MLRFLRDRGPVTLTLLLLAAALVPAQGNGRDADLSGMISGTAAVGPNLGILPPNSWIQTDLASPLGGLAGQPFALFADFLPIAPVPLTSLPGEPDVLGITPNALMLASGGLGAGPLPGLPVPGMSFGLPIPAQFPRGRLLMQGMVLDPSAPNMLAITGVSGGDLGVAPEIYTIHEPVGVIGQHGYGVHPADLTGDGIPELIATARGATTTGGSVVGRAFIYAGIPPVLQQVLDDPVPETDSNFGITAATGDINGDGFPEIVIGARRATGGGLQRAGEAMVYWGPAYTTVTTLNDLVPEQFAEFGAWVDCGDFDADGYADVAISAIRSTVQGFVNCGSVTVFYGPSLSLPVTIPDPLPINGDRFGYRVLVEDFDEDGFDDLAVTHTFRPLQQPGLTDASGAVSIFYGPFFSNFVHIPNPMPSQFGLLGSDLAAGDINGDGWCDLIAGAEFDESGGMTRQGSVFLLEGPTFQTYSQVYSPSPTADAGFGSGVDVGDFNGDGFPDLFVGEFFWDGLGANSGRVHVMHGPNWTTVDTFEEPGGGGSFEFGRRVRAGDLNGDNLSDLLIGAPMSNASGVSRAGGTYIVTLE